MNPKKFVNFDTAVLLYKLGYNEDFVFYYRTDEENHLIHHSSRPQPLNKSEKWVDDEIIPCPTLADACDWLRREKKIFIEIEFEKEHDKQYYVWTAINMETGVMFDVIDSKYPYGTEAEHEDAVSAGIDFALTKISSKQQ